MFDADLQVSWRRLCARQRGQGECTEQRRGKAHGVLCGGVYSSATVCRGELGGQERLEVLQLHMHAHATATGRHVQGKERLDVAWRAEHELRHEAVSARVGGRTYVCPTVTRAMPPQAISAGVPSLTTSTSAVTHWPTSAIIS